MKEYEELRREILERLKFQKEVERSEILLIGIFVAASPWIIENGTYVILLLASAVFFFIGMAFMEQDINIALLAKYINRRLKPRIARIARNESSTGRVFEWERFRRAEFTDSLVAGILDWNRVVTAFLPGVTPFFIYWYLKWLGTIDERWTETEIILLVVNTGLFVLLYIVSRKIPSLYLSIVPEGRSE